MRDVDYVILQILFSTSIRSINNRSFRRIKPSVLWIGFAILHGRVLLRGLYVGKRYSLHEQG